jgi:hypothetical protein
VNCPVCETTGGCLCPFLVTSLRAEVERARKVIDYIDKACLCGHHSTNVLGFEYGQKHVRMGTTEGRWLTPRERINVFRLDRALESEIGITARTKPDCCEVTGLSSAACDLGTKGCVGDHGPLVGETPEEMRDRIADEEDNALMPGGFDGH